MAISYKKKKKEFPKTRATPEVEITENPAA
jgi:hypothetical protein